MKKLSTDIAVISAGTAGLSATVTAAEGGAKVMTFEKRGITGGTANHGSGIFGVESRLQKAKQYPLTKEEAFNIYMTFTHWRVNARLVKALIDKSSESIAWLEGLGVKFFEIHSHGLGNYHTQHTVDAPEIGEKMQGRAMAMMTILAERAKALNVPLYLKTRAEKLTKEGSRISGVIARNEDGEEIQVTTKAVILATGAYGGNFPMVFNSGDGMRMAKEIGAIIKEPSILPEPENKPPPQRPTGGGRRIGFSGLMFAFQQPALVVNKLGERFMNEEIIMGSVFSQNPVMRQPEQLAYIVFDEDTKNIYKKSFDVMPGGMQQPYDKAPNFDEELKEVMEAEPDRFIKADSLEELCRKTGINIDGLKQTLDEYNTACDTGRDNAFCKKARYLRPVRQPPYYATRQMARGDTDWVGIKVNYKTEVIGTDYKTIQGLYAAGMEIACELYHDTYPFILPATAMGFAIHSGRIAAENALKYVGMK